MKKATIIGFIVIACLVSLYSCQKKEYHCHCTYNNQVVASFDLGNQTSDNAQSMCSAHDTDVTGEVWTCTTY